jgi:uncharacterized protein YkwD
MRRLLLPAVVLGTLLAPVPASAAGAGNRASRTCPDRLEAPVVGDSRAVRDAVLCLLNAERTARGLRALRASALLRESAQRFSNRLVARRFFSHVSPTGEQLADRIARTGYPPRRGSWTAAENLAWGAGEHATPREIVRHWMASTGHRRNILARGFRDAGIGVTAGVPLRAKGSPGATYVAHFGDR